jgi:hypothetical protein
MQNGVKNALSVYYYIVMVNYSKKKVLAETFFNKAPVLLSNKKKQFVNVACFSHFCKLNLISSNISRLSKRSHFHAIFFYYYIPPTLKIDFCQKSISFLQNSIIEIHTFQFHHLIRQHLGVQHLNLQSTKSEVLPICCSFQFHHFISQHLGGQHLTLQSTRSQVLHICCSFQFHHFSFETKTFEIKVLQI